MEKYKLSDFSKWADKEGVIDSTLNIVLNEISEGLVGNKLGACLYKKRVAREGQGKSGSSRVILVYKKDNLALFIYGFSKNYKKNLTKKELKQLKVYTKSILKLSLKERLWKAKEDSFVIIKGD